MKDTKWICFKAIRWNRFRFHLIWEELTGAFVDEENLENPLLDCDPEASNGNQDQEDETEDRIYGDDEAVIEENYENSKNLETENNDNDEYLHQKFRYKANLSLDHGQHGIQ